MARSWCAHPSSAALLPLESVPDHPLPTCESANMAMTLLPPLRYQLHSSVLRIATRGHLSKLQLETAAYAAQAITSTAPTDCDPGARLGGAFFLGDATGVGKTRSALGVVLDRAARALQHQEPLRVLWVSCRSDLESEVRDTLRLMESHSGEGRPLLWSTLCSALLQGRTTAATPPKRARVEQEPGGHVAFTTYATLRGGRGATDAVQGAINWLNEAPEAIVVLDEAHVAKTPTSASHAAVLRLQQQVPRAGVIYCTATAASNVAGLGYMARLGLFGDRADCPFATYPECRRVLRRQGVTAMELTALHLKSRGLYVSRMLAPAKTSMHGEPVVVPLSARQCVEYDAWCEQWTAALPGEAVGNFTSMRQSFFLRLLASFKARAVVEVVKGYVAAGWAAVVSVQHTGRGTEVTGCESIAAQCGVPPPVDFPVPPEDALDILVGELHGAEGVGPIAEITGRRSRAERCAGPIGAAGRPPTHRAARTPKQLQAEMRLFQQGSLHVALLSGAGGTGISLHAAAPSSRRRVHLLLELPWSSEALVQQCGRTHRTGESVPPLYRLVTADVPVDWRVAQCVSRRLKSLSALSRGDRDHRQVGHLDTGGESAALTTTVFQRAGFEVLMRESRERALRLCRANGWCASLRAQSCTRQSARGLMGVGKGWRHEAMQRRVAERLVHALRELDRCEGGASEEVDDLRLTCASVRLVRAQRASEVLFPDDVYDDDRRPWSRAEHRAFSGRKRRRAAAVWLCMRAPSRSNPFAALIDDVVELIVSKAVDDGWRCSPSHAVACLGRAGVGRLDLVTGSPDACFAPRLAAVPIGVQRAVWSAVDRATDLCAPLAQQQHHPQPHTTPAAEAGGAKSIAGYCYPHGTMAGCRVRLLSMHSVAGLPGHVLIAVDMLPVADPADDANAAFREALRGGEEEAPPSVFHSKGTKAIRVAVRRPASAGGRSAAWDIEVYAAGIVNPVARVTDESWPAWRDAHLVAKPPHTTQTQMVEQWMRETAAQHERRVARCAKSRVELELITAHQALYEWDSTSGDLVRDEPPFAPHPIVGVVKSVRRCCATPP